MFSIPCPGTTAPNTNTGGPTTETCATTSVQTHAIAVGNFSSARSNALLIPIITQSNKYIVLLAGYNTHTGDWIGDSVEVYAPSTGTITSVTLSSSLPEPTAVLGAPWTNYTGKDILAFYSNATDTIIIYHVHNPITYAYSIDPLTGQVESLSSLYSNWSTPPENISHGLLYPDAEFTNFALLPDNDDGTRTTAFLFSTSDNVWYNATFDSSGSYGTDIEFFHADMFPLFGQNDVSLFIYDKPDSKIYEFVMQKTNTGTGAEFSRIVRFAGTDIFAAQDSDGIAYKTELRGTGIGYGTDATYDSNGNLVDLGEGAVVSGGNRNYTNTYIDDFYHLQALNVPDVYFTGRDTITHTCPRQDAATTLFNSFQEELSKNPNLPIPDSVDTSTGSDFIQMYYFTGGVDVAGMVEYPSTLYTVVTPLKVISLLL